MGGKTAQSTQQVSIPPSVLAQYQSVNASAGQTAQTPFQQYGGQFVAPVNSEQASGIAGTNTAANEAQPYYGAATGVLGASQAGVNPVNNQALNTTAANGQPVSAGQIDQYLSPYLNTVMGSTANVLNQNNQQQQAGQLGDAITSGAFGGDRTGIAAANLEEQQNLANSQIYSGIANTGYQSALGTALGEQQVGLSAGAQEAQIGQTAYGEGANTASELASLGSGAQTAGLAGASAQIGAGTLQQQTSQAQDTAEYNQFLQQQSYPFQVDQFLANIAEGTGALSGSTTTTTQPGGFFSDKRLKYNIEKIGKTYDGQTIYSYKMHGDPRTHIGLIAQEVEKKTPHAVGIASGFKTVDYGKATEKAANRGHFEGGGVVLPFRRKRDAGGYTGPYGDLSDIVAGQENMYAPNQTRNRNIPAQQAQQHQLAVANGSPPPRPTGASNVQQTYALGNDAYKVYNHFNPSTTPGSGVAGGGSGGNVPAMNSGYFSPSSASAQPVTDFSSMGPVSPVAAPGAADASGVAAGSGPAAAATPGTASLAAPAAADAASAGAASAAGAGATAAGSAAAGAAGGAAAEGGADAAAALAAEYAAADVGVAALAAKRGGRMGYDAGGMPYSGVAAGAPYSSTGGDMDIPDTENANTLKTAGALQKQPTGLQTLMTLGSQQGASDAIGSIFSNQGLGSRRGGRIHKDGGGSLDDADPNQDPDLNPQGVARGVIDRSGSGLMYSRDPGAVVPTAEKAPPTDSRDTIFSNDDAQGPWDDQNADMGGKNFGVAGGGWDTKTPRSIQSGVTAAAPPSTQQVAPAKAQAASPANPTPPSAYNSAPVSGADPGSTPTADVKQSWWDKIKGSELAKPENLVPLLSAIGAMGTYPTKHLGVALAAGLQGGANAYYPAQEAKAGIAQTQANTQNIGARTSGQQISNIAELQNQYALKGFALLPDPNGPIQAPDGGHYRAIPKASLATSGAPQAPNSQYRYLGANGKQAAAGEGMRTQMAPDDAKASSQKQIEDIYSSGNAAQQNMLNIQRWEQSVAANPTGVLKPGAFNDARTQAANIWNTAADQLGHPEFKINGLDDATMAEKTSRGAAAMSENEHQQRSFGALKAFLQQTPNTNMPRDAALNLIGDVHAENQAAVDKKNYLDEFDQETQRNFAGGAPIPRNYLAPDALQAFDKDYPSNAYQGERNKLVGIISSPRYRQLMDQLQNGSPEQKQATLKKLDDTFGPNFHRYFTGS